MLTHRWFYAAINLQVDDNLRVLTDLLRRAKAANYNGVLFADYKLGILDRVPEHYFRNLDAVKTEAARLGIEMVPAVCSCGYDSALLSHDPNLAEAVPVVDAPFQVRNGVLAPIAPRAPHLPGGDFETFSSNTAAGWDYQDEPGKMSFADRIVKFSGESSLRFDNPGKNNPPSGNARVSRKLACRPFTAFRLTVMVKTRGYDGAGEFHATVLGDDPSGKSVSLSHLNAGVKPDQDWTKHAFVFNSLRCPTIRVYVGTWNGKNGSIWLDDVVLEEIGPQNIVRRDACPLTIVGENGVVYAEGRDFERVVDPKLGQIPYAGEYDFVHDAPPIVLAKTSRLTEGERVKVSWFHVVGIYDNQVAASLVDPKVFALHADQIARVKRALDPTGYFLSHDELRIAGWGNDATRSGKSVGKQLAENVAKCAQLVKRESPNAKTFVWSDMFDPFHNAVDNYYLVNGSLAGSWDGVPKSTVVMNWNSGKARESLGFFAGRGHDQILAGYYDGSVDSITRWLDTAKGLPSGGRVVGAMYTTWRGDYKNLEAFAKRAWG